MKNHLLFGLFLLIFHPMWSHPSYGIVVTAEGDLIFCDVLHQEGTIWKFDKAGKLTRILTGEHCHFIFQDYAGRIWGTNHEYLESQDTNRNTLWRLVNEKKEIVIPPTLDPETFSGVNFVVDRSDNIYFNVDRRLYVRSPDAGTQVLTQHEFGRIMSLQLAQDGQIIVVDNRAGNGSLIKVSAAGKLTIVGSDLLEAAPPDPPFENPMLNMLFAAFDNGKGHIFVANSGSRRITRVDSTGNATHIYHSEAPWYPVAYTEKDGQGFIMEMGFVPGQGNIGPRIHLLENGAAQLLLNVDDPTAGKAQSDRPFERSKTKENRSNSKRSNWLWYGLGGALVVILGLAVLKK